MACLPPFGECPPHQAAIFLAYLLHELTRAGMVWQVPDV